MNSAIIHLYEEGKVIRLLEEIEAYANNRYSLSVPSERASMLITALTRNWSLFEVEDRGPLSIPFNWRFLFCVDPLLKIINSQVRFSYICMLFNDESVQPSTLALLLHDFETQHGRFTKKEEASNRNDALFTLDEVLSLESIFEKRSMAALDSGAALKQNNGLTFLWMLEQLAPEQAANKEKALVSDDISLVKVISYGVSKGTISTQIITKIRVLDRQKINKFIDIDEGYRRVKSFFRIQTILYTFQRRPNECSCFYSYYGAYSFYIYANRQYCRGGCCESTEADGRKRFQYVNYLTMRLQKGV